MTSGTLITDYLDRGTFAARPVTPPVPTDGMAFYYATDTAALYTWDGSAWQTALVVGGGGLATAYDWDIENGQLSSIFVHPTDGRSITGIYNGGGYGGIRAFQARSTGKYYFECLVGIVGNHSPFVGVGSSSTNLASFPGNDVNAWSIGCASTSWHNNSGTAQNSCAAGDIIGVAVDFTAATGSIKFFKNNVAQSNAYTSLTLGTMYPMVGMGNGTSFNSRCKIGLRAAEQTYTPPAGYSSWI